MGAMRLWRTNELYPPETPADIKATLTVLLADKDLEGRTLLRRSLEGAERDALRRRSRELDPWTEKPRDGEIETLILEMSLGLKTKGENDEESALRVSHYAEILADTPLWAIKRACDRFERCEVTADELGEKQSPPRGVVPSTAHLYRVASAFSRPIFHERIRIHEALNGVVARRGPATEEDKADVAATLARFKRSVGAESVVEVEKREIARQDVLQKTAEANELVRRAEFTKAGLDEPHPSVSLSMLLRLGHTIIDGPDGEKALLAPGTTIAKPAPYFNEPRPREPKSVASAAKGILR